MSKFQKEYFEGYNNFINELKLKNTTLENKIGELNLRTN